MPDRPGGDTTAPGIMLPQCGAALAFPILHASSPAICWRAGIGESAHTEGPMDVIAHESGIRQSPDHDLDAAFGCFTPGKRMPRFREALRLREPGYCRRIARISLRLAPCGQAASSSRTGSSPSTGLPRRGPLASAASISLTASVSVTRCTAEISRDSRSRAAS
jgi:hypothetical protein